MTRPSRGVRLITICVLAVLAAMSSPAVARQTNAEDLERLAVRLKGEFDARQGPLYLDLLSRTTGPQGRLNRDPSIRLMGIMPDGHPLFYTTNNVDAAASISTDEVWPGGTSGYDLTGSNSLGELAIWDADAVRVTHQEFGGRVSVADGETTTHPHATHVAGTLVAAGTVASARGMSHAAHLHSYDWSYDESEMASAASAGLLVSNHSYIFVTGWRYDSGSDEWFWFGDADLDPNEDPGFGFYRNSTRDWDQIAFDAPHYLIFKSAGNDRNDSPPAGTGHWVWDSEIGDWAWSTATRAADGAPLGYDCIPPRGNAKNIVTMGAVHDIPGGWMAPGDVVMSDFSSWGPTDDGRIKPDLVANGVILYSPLDGSDTDYGSYSGTSMSSPSAAGSAHLLVQQYKGIHGGTPPLAATVKALLIHTADEAGPNEGPDYSFGWGLMNTRAAADIIASDDGFPDRIQEHELADGGFEMQQLYANGSTPLKATLVWTDPPGTPPAWSLDPPTPMLVHDLDLILTEVSDGTAHYVRAGSRLPDQCGDHGRQRSRQRGTGLYRPTGRGLL